ncbi:DUF4153 domain-containing protein [Jiella sp. M17.18]
MAALARQRLARLTGSLARGAGVAANRFPVAALAIIAIAVLGNLAVEDVFLPDEANLPWLLAALYGAAASSVVAVTALEARGFGRLARFAASLGVAVVLGLATYFGRDFGIYAPPLVAAATLAVPLAPFVERPDQRRFWTFTLWTVVGVALAFFSVLLFTLGLSAILEMIRFLFEVGLSSAAYEHIFVTAFSLVGPLFALGRIPADFDQRVGEADDDRLVAGLRILFAWVAAPLVLVTALVLHLYALKIALTANVPDGEIGWIVTFYALLVLMLRVAAQPFLRDKAPAMRLFGRLWGGILVVPLVLLVIAIWQRVAAEGVTLPRYYVALAAVAALGVLALQLFPRMRADSRVMAAVPIGLLALSAFGPWGAADTVGRSQTSRLIAEYGAALPGSGAIGLRSTDRSDRAHHQIRSRLEALRDAGEVDRILPYLEPDLATRVQLAEATRPDETMTVLAGGLGLYHVAAASTARGFTALRQPVVDLSGFDRGTMERSVIASSLAPDNSRLTATTGDVQLWFSDADLVAVVDGTRDDFPIVDAIANLPDAIFSSEPDNTSAPILDLTSRAGRHVRVAIRQMVQQSPGGAILSATLTFYFHAAEWPGGAPAASATAMDPAPATAAEAITRQPPGQVPSD